MEVKIGETIKKLRMKHNMTQERLAEYLNVSYQTVSKWENGISFPSVALIPSIANVFNVSIDELYGLGKEDRLKRYEEEYRRLCGAGDNRGRVELMRRALSEFPRNYSFMDCLARSLYWEGLYDEVFVLCHRILKECTADETRFSALQTLVRAYGAVGRTDKAQEYAAKIPTILMAREFLLADLYEGGRQKGLVQENVLKLVDAAAKMLVIMAGSGGDTGEEPSAEEKIALFQRSNMLYGTVLDGNRLWVNAQLYYNYEHIARNYCFLGDREHAMENLLYAERAARDADAFFGGQGVRKFTSECLKGLETDPQGFGKHWQGSHCQKLYEKLQKSCYDLIRGTEGFQAVEDRLKDKAGRMEE